MGIKIYSNMNLKQTLSWKFLLPTGVILWLFWFLSNRDIISEVIGFIGFFMVIMGIIDLNRLLRKRAKEEKTKEDINL